MNGVGAERARLSGRERRRRSSWRSKLSSREGAWCALRPALRASGGGTAGGGGNECSHPSSSRWKDATIVNTRSPRCDAAGRAAAGRGGGIHRVKNHGRVKGDGSDANRNIRRTAALHGSRDADPETGGSAACRRESILARALVTAQPAHR